MPLVDDTYIRQPPVEQDAVNAMSVDVEDYFQVSVFERYLSRESWVRMPSRVERNTHRVLALLERNGAKATFFVLGWVAERAPVLIREIVAAGHELASHGYCHVRVVDQTPERFMEDVTRTKHLLEDVSGHCVRGYRAASYSIGADNLWAHEVLHEAGYEYSSSIYPIHHDLYGMPEAPRKPFRPRQGGVPEIPIGTFRLAGVNLPCGGGGYFRLLPYPISRWAIRRVNHREKRPCVFYFHPWELDPEQPRKGGTGLKTRFRHYLNLERMESRLERLLKDFCWDRMDRVYLTESKSRAKCRTA